MCWHDCRRCLRRIGRSMLLRMSVCTAVTVWYSDTYIICLPCHMCRLYVIIFTRRRMHRCIGSALVYCMYHAVSIGTACMRVMWYVMRMPVVPCVLHVRMICSPPYASLQRPGARPPVRGAVKIFEKGPPPYAKKVIHPRSTNPPVKWRDSMERALTYLPPLYIPYMLSTYRVIF